MHNIRSPLASHHVPLSLGRDFCTARKRNLRHIAIWPRAMTSLLLFFWPGAERTAAGKLDGAVTFALEPTGVSRSKAQRSLGKFGSPAPKLSSSPQPRTPSWIFGFVFVFVFCLALPSVCCRWMELTQADDDDSLELAAVSLPTETYQFGSVGYFAFTGRNSSPATVSCQLKVVNTSQSTESPLVHTSCA